MTVLNLQTLTSKTSCETFSSSKINKLTYLINRSMTLLANVKCLIMQMIRCKTSRPTWCLTSNHLKTWLQLSKMTTCKDWNKTSSECTNGKDRTCRNSPCQLLKLLNDQSFKSIQSLFPNHQDYFKYVGFRHEYLIDFSYSSLNHISMIIAFQLIYIV